MENSIHKLSARLCLIGLSFAFSSVEVHAADADRFSGFSIGLHLQHTWSEFDFTQTPVVSGPTMSSTTPMDDPEPPMMAEPTPPPAPVGKPPGDGNAGGFGGGIHVGYDAAVAQRIVLGAIADLSIGDWKYNYDFGGTLVGYYDSDYRISLRGRAGYVVLPNLLAYVTGGAAWSRMEHGGTGAVHMHSGPSRISFTSSGWIAGAGLELAVPQVEDGSLIVFGEYLHTDYGEELFFLHGEDHEFEFINNTARVGLKYRF